MVATTAIPAVSDIIDDRLARRNSIILAIANGLYSCSAINIIITAGLVGAMLASDKAWATLPVTTFILGTVCSTVPASLLMAKIGRRNGFALGAMFGVTSGLLAVYAIYVSNFGLFMLATFLNGTYQAFAMYYRFAAADIASSAFRPKAISWVMIGGIAGATIGPLIVINTKEWLSPVLFAGSYLASALIGLLATVVVGLVKIPHRAQHKTDDKGRPLSQIMRQPRVIVAIFCGMSAYCLMNLLMTATPLAMVGCGFTADDSAWVIQWHALAMYVPSFFTGSLIARFKAERVILAGLVLLMLAAFVALTGITFGNFAIGLILLGLGWNFGFIGATAMLAETYQSSEKAKVQALNDQCVFIMVALASLSSGQLLDAFGWNAVNLALFPIAGLCIIALIWLMIASRGKFVTAAE